MSVFSPISESQSGFLFSSVFSHRPGTPVKSLGIKGYAALNDGASDLLCVWRPSASQRLSLSSKHIGITWIEGTNDDDTEVDWLRAGHHNYGHLRSPGISWRSTALVLLPKRFSKQGLGASCHGVC